MVTLILGVAWNSRVTWQEESLHPASQKHYTTSTCVYMVSLISGVAWNSRVKWLRGIIQSSLPETLYYKHLCLHGELNLRSSLKLKSNMTRGIISSSLPESLYNKHLCLHGELNLGSSLKLKSNDKRNHSIQHLRNFILQALVSTWWA